MSQNTIEKLKASTTPAGDAVAYALFLLSSMEEVPSSRNNDEGIRFAIERVTPELPFKPYVTVREIVSPLALDKEEILSTRYVNVRQLPGTEFFTLEFLQANNKGAWASYHPADIGTACKDILAYLCQDEFPEHQMLIPIA